MNEWIINASPLILLGKIDRLALLPELADRVFVPSSVAEEILAGPCDDPANRWISSAPAGIVVTPDVSAAVEILAWDLGKGETAVISMGMNRANAVCVLDDLAARTCAGVFGIPVIGTLGILLKAKAAGRIPSMSAEIDRLLAAGSMLSQQVILRAIQLAGETP